jgi:hypothetical protein
LTSEGGALRASSSAQVAAYILAYKKIDAKWFSDFAMKRVETRAKMKRYIGKTKTLASFFHAFARKQRSRHQLVRDRNT